MRAIKCARRRERARVSDPLPEKRAVLGETLQINKRDSAASRGVFRGAPYLVDPLDTYIRRHGYVPTQPTTTHSTMTEFCCPSRPRPRALPTDSYTIAEPFPSSWMTFSRTAPGMASAAASAPTLWAMSGGAWPEGWTRWGGGSECGAATKCAWLLPRRGARERAEVSSGALESLGGTSTDGT